MDQINLQSSLIGTKYQPIRLRASPARVSDRDSSFEPNTATEFIAEIFVRGTSACRCRVWLGGMFSSDGISYAEGQIYHGNNACNEMLSVEEDQGELYLSALMAMGFSQIERDLDVKRMNQEQAADYLWRRFLAPLVR